MVGYVAQKEDSFFIHHWLIDLSLILVCPMITQCVIRQVSCFILSFTYGPICDKQMRCSGMNFKVSWIQDGVWSHIWIDLQFPYRICPSYLDSTFSDNSFDLRRGIEGVLFHECSIRKEMCPAPCWRNKSIIPIPPSDGGPYLTSVWIVMMKLGRGRPYFMGAAIT